MTQLFPTELELLPWRATVPIVKTTARMLADLPEPQAKRQWQSLLNKLAAPLIDAGVPMPTVRQHLLSFRDAVETALLQLGDPDGGTHLSSPVTAPQRREQL
ncbi:DUF6074 family protein [uncultured Roseibium sp.]|uniref:DUF6074 family protein n=1 Tax=uncultured Roseibium sp. TaxID=1936171 RepID=UPI0032176E78